MLTKPAVAAGALSLALGSAIDTAFFRAAGLYDCPELCSVAGAKTGNWTRFNSNYDLNWCKNETMLISLPVYMPLNDTATHSVFYACLSSRGGEVQSRVQGIQKRAQAADGFILHSEVNFIKSSVKSKHSNFADDTSTAIKELQAKYLDVPNSDNNQTIYFAKRGTSAIGVYVGGNVQKQSIAATLMQRLQDYIAFGSDLSETSLFQLCGDGRNADSVAGVVAVGRDGLDSVFAVQGFVRTWVEGRCVTDVDGHSKTETMDISYVATNALLGSNDKAANGSSTVHPQRRSGSSSDSQIDPKTMWRYRVRYCSIKQVSGGDGCAQLAAKCGLSPADFTKLHSESDFCSTLQPGQWFCCTRGSLPDMRPKERWDGSCYPYEVAGGDTCAKIAAAHSLKWEDIEKLNQNTWGFAGCNSLWPHMLICLSPGLPPMPAPVANAKCGPQVPGTKRPLSKDTSMSDLNPCPLNACCNVWGQCGTTAEFCIESSLGPPGTSKPGENGCISNCGMEIVNNGVGPATQITLGYFEAWNYNRGCLHMDVTQMSRSISHIHFAFIDVTAGFAVSVAPDVRDQWDKFKGMSGYHKVAAFGGWAASTEPTSYWIFREGVKPQNRDRLAENLANFITSNNMDGIDLDWEYPGAQDIPGIPAANPLDGKGYLELLKLLREKLGNDKTISIAAPASYWYLQNFPIAKISKIVDYIVYMTYDLHGQWDYGNKWSAPGCAGLSCLRSHINMTETLNSLSMITKAGVPSNKIVVGVSSYGRSFEMTQPGCTGPQCSFTGPQSTAKKGRCTDTSGYISNAEIDEIISSRRTQQFTDETESQILAQKRWAGLNFAGSTDWAVDLATFTPGDDNQQCWRTKKCTSPAVTQTDGDNKWRWDELCSDGAWEAAMEHWKHKRDSPFAFPNVVSDFFRGVSGMDCDILASENGCRSNMMCIEGYDTGPAATFILNGFVTMSNVLLNMYEGIEASQQTLEVNGRLDGFVKTFAPKPKEELGIKIILDIVSFGLSAATGPFFNNCRH